MRDLFVVDEFYVFSLDVIVVYSLWLERAVEIRQGGLSEHSVVVSDGMSDNFSQWSRANTLCT